MTKKQATNKIKNHILKYGNNTNFEITTRVINYWWNVLNICLFDNKLLKPKIKTKYLPKIFADAGGEYKKKEDGYEVQVEIRFDPSKIYTRAHFICVLAHEMVHQYQFLYRSETHYSKRMDHGKTFYEWKDIIENIIGVKLTKYVDYYGFDILVTE